MKNFLATSLSLIFLLTACSLPFATPADTPDVSAPIATTAAPPTALPTDTPAPTLAPPTETLTLTSVPPTSTPTAIPVVESLGATVTADLLSCRYGPGSEYLYLYGLKKGANIQLIGRTNGNNWVMVKGKNLCWVNSKFIEIKGDPQTLQVMYPDGYKLPVSPYYSATTVLSAVRDPNKSNNVTVKWMDIALTAGDEEDENMFIYIVEVWRCEGEKLIFDPLASNYPEVTFVDEAGCNVPSHGRVFFQEKHGFAGPAEIPWPAQ
jgi:uncharacterized protein YraI